MQDMRLEEMVRKLTDEQKQKLRDAIDEISRELLNMAQEFEKIEKDEVQRKKVQEALKAQRVKTKGRKYEKPEVLAVSTRGKIPRQDCRMIRKILPIRPRKRNAEE